MKIYLASDHAGFKLKEEIKKKLSARKDYEIKDLGANTYKEDDDYPDFMHRLGRILSKDKKSRGLVFGGSGQGEAMVGNRYRGVRAAVVYSFSKKAIVWSREHNDANVLSLGARFLTQGEAWEAVEIWLKTDFSAVVRHRRRIKKIDK